MNVQHHHRRACGRRRCACAQCRRRHRRERGRLQLHRHRRDYGRRCRGRHRCARARVLPRRLRAHARGCRRQYIIIMMACMHEGANEGWRGKCVNERATHMYVHISNVSMTACMEELASKEGAYMRG